MWILYIYVCVLYIYICIYRLCYTFIYINIYKYSDTKISFYFIYRGVPDWEVVVLWPGCKNHHIEEDPQSPQLDAESSDCDANHQSSCQKHGNRWIRRLVVSQPKNDPDEVSPWDRIHVLELYRARDVDESNWIPDEVPRWSLRCWASCVMICSEPQMLMSQTGSPMRSRWSPGPVLKPPASPKCMS